MSDNQIELIRNYVHSLSQDDFSLLAGKGEIPDSFLFSMDSYVVLAQILLKIDASLSEKRHALVPDLIEEDDFWRNYFYKVSQFKRSIGLQVKEPEPPMMQAEQTT